MYFFKLLSRKYGNFSLHFLADLYIRLYGYAGGYQDRYNSAYMYCGWHVIKYQRGRGNLEGWREGFY